MILMLTAFIYGLFGLIIGSFLNVVILRHGARTVGGRSGCLSCGAPLLWYDMVPVASWLALRGRCRACGSRISIQYPLVEAATALLFAIIGIAALSIPLKLAALAIAALLVLIAAYDIRHTIIPDAWVYSFALLAFVVSSPFALSTAGESGATGILLLLLAGPVCALPLFALWAVSRGRWMGFGDVKLALGIGWLLGLPSGLSAIFLAFVIGAVISLGMLLVQHLRVRVSRRARTPGRITGLGSETHGLTMKSEVPFGPFLIAACLLLWLLMMFSISVPLLDPFSAFMTLV
jgi:leader peptidase (prepilin peptidase)/N-methyltransferase